jgi:hypothetical protein
MHRRSTRRIRQRTSPLDSGALTFKFTRSIIPWSWVASWAAVLVLPFLVIWGQISLFLTAALSVGLVGILVLATIQTRPKLMFMFFLNACLLVVARRDVGGVDAAALLSSLTALLVAFNFASNKPTPGVTPSSANRNFDLTQYLLIGFAVLSIISTLANGQSLIAVVPWISGVVFTLLISRVPFSQLPSFSSARRAILAGGAVAATYDLYLLGTGKALNLGPFNAGRFVGSLGDYELLAEFYGAVILLALTAIFFDQSRAWRAAAGVLILPSFLIMVATQSRGPIILLCAVVPVLILISFFQFRESAGKILAVVVIVALGLGSIVGTLSATPLIERFSAIQLGGSIETTINRAGVWDYFSQLPRFVNLSWVGNGFDYPYAEIGTFPHSLYLWLLWSGGPVLLVCFGLLACTLLGRLCGGIVFRHSGSLSAAAVVVYILLDEVKIEAARTSPTVTFLWAFLSLAVLASREQREL